jgi:hypothetical protein
MGNNYPRKKKKKDFIFCFLKDLLFMRSETGLGQLVGSF